MPDRRIKPFGADVAIVVTLFAFTSVDIAWFAASYGERLAALTVILLMTGAQLFRRTSPVLMLTLMILGGLLALLFYDHPTSAVITVPFGAYAFARWAPPKTVPAVLWVGLTSAVAAVLRWYNPDEFTVETEWQVGTLVNVSVLRGIAEALILFGACVAFVVAPYLIGRRVQEHETNLLAAAEALRQHEIYELAQAAATAKANAAELRTSIARELHDAVAHSVSVMVTQADGALAVLRTRPELVAPALEAISDAGRTALNEMRNIVSVLRDGSSAEYLPSPTVADLPALIANASERVSLELTGDPTRVMPTTGLTLYRVVQESITNFLKHAGPDAKAQVKLDLGADIITLEISDDGYGALVLNDGHGNGLLGMRERVVQLGGSFFSGPRTGGGYVVRATLPMDRYMARPMDRATDRLGEI